MPLVDVNDGNDNDGKVTHVSKVKPDGNDVNNGALIMVNAGHEFKLICGVLRNNGNDNDGKLDWVIVIPLPLVEFSDRNDNSLANDTLVMVNEPVMTPNDGKLTLAKLGQLCNKISVEVSKPASVTSSNNAILYT